MSLTIQKIVFVKCDKCGRIISGDVTNDRNPWAVITVLSRNGWRQRCPHELGYDEKGIPNKGDYCKQCLEKMPYDPHEMLITY